MDILGFNNNDGFTIAGGGVPRRLTVHGVQVDINPSGIYLDGVLYAGGGGGGTSDHAALSNLSYANSGHTGFEISGAAFNAISTHESTYNHALLHSPATAGAGISITGQVVTNTDLGSAAVAAHLLAVDPHPLYLTSTEAGGLYQPLEDQRLSTTDNVEFNTIKINNGYTPTGNEAVGTIYWNEVNGTFNFVLKNGSVLEAGQRIDFYGKAQGNIVNGDPVQFVGVQGDHILMKKAVGSELDTNPSYFIGIATQNINNGDFGYTTWFGEVSDIWTKTPNNNDVVNWIPSNILFINILTGYLTTTEPEAPHRRIQVAVVIKSQTGNSETGKIFVRPTLGMKIGDLDDVDGEEPTKTGDLISYNDETGIWERGVYNIQKFENILDKTKDPTGWINNEGIDVSYNTTDRTITLTGDLRYMWHGIERELTSPWTSTAHATGDGIFFLSSADGLNFTWSTTPWEFSVIQVAIAYVNMAGNYMGGLREVHGLMPWQAHEEFHQTISAYRLSGGELTTGTYALNTATDSATTPGFERAFVKDEDLTDTIEAWTEGTYTTMRIGASSMAMFDTNSSFPFRNTLNGYINVNNPLTGAETEGINNRFYNVYQILIPTTSDSESQKYRMVMLQPQATFTTLETAQAEDSRGLNLGNLTASAPEFIFYSRITYGTASGNANTGKVRIRGVTYVAGTRLSQVSIGDFSPANHNSLVGLQGGTTDEYYHLTSSQATDVANLATTYEPKNSNIQSHISSTSNPHSVTKTQVGLGSVPDLDTTNAVNKAHDAVTVADSTSIDFTLSGQQISASAIFGTTAGTVCQGNDSRLSDSREWTADTVTQAEAEAGTATTRRAWTAQRVRQAIVAWWGTITKREILTADRTYYVATTGNDNNNGLTSGTAFATVQKAIDTVASLDCSVYNVVIQLANGTYSQNNILLKPIVGTGNVTIRGNTSNYDSVILNGGSGYIVWQTAPCATRYNFEYMRFTSTSIMHFLQAFCFIGYNQVHFVGGGASAWGLWTAVVCDVTFRLNTFYISGTFNSVLRVDRGTLNVFGTTYTCLSTPTFTSFMRVGQAGTAIAASGTTSGAATGLRYSVSLNGILELAATILPGNSAGTSATGGQVV